ncbi:IS3 family transposase [Propionibacterium australiense]|uniref:Integrase, catalytic core n=1 Tax=Propionibacterium australiense TaxID=119981 RepID=A0A383S9D0_9ACTN|nr:IS3 family transposase [Propionibacterium australiense]SYZ34610.1 Integrase, catalytic core [Propionibacterium australiense]VEH92510.1 insertion element IS2 transposase InsD [Propionibacterium australiense]
MSAKYRCIHREEGNYPIQSMCRWVKVSKSGYYAWRNRPKSLAAQRREDLAAIIVKFFDESEQTYGYRRIHAELARSGVKVSPDTVRKIMATAGLVACQPRKRARTTIPAPDLPDRPDRLRRDFTATAPGMKWVGDITYVPTWQGFVYLAVVMDCFSKKIVGHAIAGHMRTGLVTQALAMAVRNCPPTRGVTVFHSDRGSQYTSAEYTKFMTGHGILPSVGRTGSCFDNAAAESFNAILKKELTNRKVYPTRNHAIRDVTAWIELRYNHKHLHSAIDYRTPNQVDTEWRQQHRAAA